MMADHRRELEALRYQHEHERLDWQSMQRSLINQIEELERKLKAARDELEDTRATLALHRSDYGPR